MRNAWRGVGFFTLVCALVGCQLLKKKVAEQDAATEAGSDASSEVVDATAAAPAPTAGNESDVKRYDDETKIDPTTATIQWTVANVKTAAGEGDLVGVLKKGTEVSKLAEHTTYTLVVFNDPTNADKKLMGWVGKSVFTPEVKVDAGKVHPKCATGEGLLLLEGGDERCVSLCTADTQCPRGYGCTGDGPLSENGQAGKMVRFCNLAGKRIEDAGAPPQDAGKPVDAGAPKDAGTVKDAGAGGKQITAKKNAAGICPLGFTVSSDICRLKCAKDTDCGSTGKCVGAKCYSVQ